MFQGIEDGMAKTSKGDIKYKVIVGADGPGSKVAQNLGLAKNRNPYPAVTAQVKGDFGDSMKMFFGGIAPGAYGWIIPKDGRANIGVGMSPKFSNGSLRSYFEKFTERNGLIPETK
ncbi:MAG: NAD(P)/FAD-dependent oxidoreductase, partial [Candidatus Methanomethylophilaceae archaeon]|nr:NAD(P)/FAD-dependent oxidoreductase [Candidatus Methanomethylophilaceae archaeon]